MPKPIHRPLIPLTIAMIFGVLSGEAYPGYGAWILLLAVSLGSILVGFLIRNKRVLVLPILFFGCVGYLAIQPWVAPRFQSDHVWHYIDSPASQIHGKVVSQPVYRHKRTRLAMEIESMGSDEQLATLQGRVSLTIAGEPVALSKGDRISYFGRIRSIRNFNNPGGFDYERYMAYQKVWARSYAASHKLSIHPKIETSKHRLNLSERRLQVAGWIDGQVIWSYDSGMDIKAISKALLVGDRSDISNELRQSFNRSGVGHLLAISGLHVGIVATAAYMLFRFLTSWIPLLLRVGWTRKAAAILTFIPVLAYGFLAGMSPSTQRAVIMAGVFLLTLLLDRDQDLTNTICIAGAVILIIHPPALFSISFQLSFAAVLAIVWGMALMQSVLKGRLEGYRVVTKLIMFFAVSGFAVLGTTPLVMVYFNQISLIGTLVNLIAIPLVGFLAVPLGLLGVFFHFFIPPLANIFLLGSHWILGLAIIIIQFFSNFPWAAVETITPSRFEVGLYYLTLFSGFIWIYPPWQKIMGLAENENKRKGLFAMARCHPAEKADNRGVAQGEDGYSSSTTNLHVGILQKKVRYNWKPKPGKTRFVWAYLMIGLIAGAWLLDGSYWLYQRFWNRNLRITVFDVGQGAATLLELPKGATMLIDGGGFSGTASFDTGRNIIAPYLLRKKILSIDTMVLSHPNSDHLNGLIYISKKFKVKKAITNNQPADTMGYRHLMRALEERNIDTPSYRTLVRNMEFAGGQMEILHPPRDFLSQDQAQIQQSRNNNSIVIKVTHGQHAFLFPGDIMATGERMLATSAEHDLKSTVLISPHHGSDTSSTPRFLSAVDPVFVVISCGWQNRFGMPKPAVLDRYTDRGYRILRTDKDGAVQMWSNGEKLTITSKQPRVLKATL